MKQGNMIEEFEKYYTEYIAMKFIPLTAFPPSSCFLRVQVEVFKTRKGLESKSRESLSPVTWKPAFILEIFQQCQ